VEGRGYRGLPEDRKTWNRHLYKVQEESSRELLLYQASGFTAEEDFAVICGDNYFKSADMMKDVRRKTPTQRSFCTLLWASGSFV
jgi:dTDP-glucose pyrophosphorylase